MSEEPDGEEALRGRARHVRVPVSLERSVAALAMGAICLISFANVVVRYVTDFSFRFYRGIFGVSAGGADFYRRVSRLRYE